MKHKVLILIFALFFGVVSPLLQTESFIENLNNIRRSYLLSEKRNTETIVLRTNKWNAIADKKELFFNNHYYDVKKIERSKNNQVTVTIIKDRFENIIKNSLPQAEPKKIKTKMMGFAYAFFEALNCNLSFFSITNKNRITCFVVAEQYQSFVHNITKPPIF